MADSAYRIKVEVKQTTGEGRLRVSVWQEGRGWRFFHYNGASPHYAAATALNRVHPNTLEIPDHVHDYLVERLPKCSCCGQEKPLD